MSWFTRIMNTAGVRDAIMKADRGETVPASMSALRKAELEADTFSANVGALGGQRDDEAEREKRIARLAAAGVHAQANPPAEPKQPKAPAPDRPLTRHGPGRVRVKPVSGNNDGDDGEEASGGSLGDVQLTPAGQNRNDGRGNSQKHDVPLKPTQHSLVTTSDIYRANSAKAFDPKPAHAAMEKKSGSRTAVDPNVEALTEEEWYAKYNPAGLGDRQENLKGQPAISKADAGKIAIRKDGGPANLDLRDLPAVAQSSRIRRLSQA